MLMAFSFCRDDWIRTSDLLHPMQARYRAALRPELFSFNTGIVKRAANVGEQLFRAK